jgi:hypothetical protein
VTTRGRLHLLARGLFVAAAVVIGLMVAAAIAVAGAEDTVPFIDVISTQSRTAGALTALAGGIIGAGILAGLGGILTVMLERDRADR